MVRLCICCKSFKKYQKNIKNIHPKRKIEERYYINELPIIATLSKAIQEQQEQINKLQNKIEELEARR